MKKVSTIFYQQIVLEESKQTSWRSEAVVEKVATSVINSFNVFQGENHHNWGSSSDEEDDDGKMVQELDERADRLGDEADLLDDT